MVLGWSSLTQPRQELPDKKNTNTTRFPCRKPATSWLGRTTALPHTTSCSSCWPLTHLGYSSGQRDRRADSSDRRMHASKCEIPTNRSRTAPRIAAICMASSCLDTSGCYPDMQYRNLCCREKQGGGWMKLFTGSYCPKDFSPCVFLP